MGASAGTKGGKKKGAGGRVVAIKRRRGRVTEVVRRGKSGASRLRRQTPKTRRRRA